ncbi:hypothetical protein [Microcoleus sp. herbarium14]
MFGIWCEGRSQFVQSLYCLVFGVRGDRTPLNKPYESAIGHEA